MRQNRTSHISISVALMFGFITGAFAFTPTAHAQWFEDTYPGFYSLQTPGMLQASAFSGGFGSDKYGVVQEGGQVEQSITPYIGAFGRATAYQLWIGSGFDSPLAPGS